MPDLARAVGADQVITDPAALRTYESDALTGYRAIPQAVVLPASTAEVAAVVAVCAAHGIPFVARGAGTGLSGGAVPVAEGIVIGLDLSGVAVSSSEARSPEMCPTSVVMPVAVTTN